MTVEKLYQELSDFLESAYHAKIFDDAVRELEILVTRLRIRMVSGVYEPQKVLSCDGNVELEKLLQSAELGVNNLDCCRMIREIVVSTRRVLSKEGMLF